MIGTLALSLAAIVGGALATYLYDPESPPLSRLFTGACTGYAALALLGFLASWVLGLGPLSMALAALVVLLPVVLLRRPAFRGVVAADLASVRTGVQGYLARPSRGATAALVFWATLGIALWFVLDRVIFSRPDGLYTGFVNNLGDLPLHLQITSSFAYGANLPPENPVFLGTTYSYPYMSDFLAAMFVSAGADFRIALLIPNVVLAASLVGVLQRWTHDLTRDRLAAAIAPLLLLLSGGLGWLQVLDEARRGESGFFAALGALDHDVTITGDSIFRFGNAITTLLVPQRSLLFGIPIAIVVFTLLWAELREEGNDEDPTGFRGSREGGRRGGPIGVLAAEPRMAAAGLMTGMLLLIHAYLFVAVMATAFFHGLLFRQWRGRRWRRWVLFVVAALIVAIPELLWSTIGSSVSAGNFIGVQVGWDRGDRDPILFWLANAGLFIALLVLAFLLDREPAAVAEPGIAAVEPAYAAAEPEPLVSRRLLFYYLPFVLWFVIPNVLRLAPWIWDNIKVLFVWYLGSVPLVALVLATMLRQDGLRRAIGVVLLVAVTLSGGIDVARVVLRQPEYREFDVDGIALAGAIRDKTPPRAVVLHGPTYNPPVFLTGRRSVMGYPGHIWSSGIDGTMRERDIRAIYAGEPEAMDLLRQYGVDF
ncbi:MAG TPA: hypothetical protein VEX41_00410, partial [Candidatus Eisenbacteria bacterium]|nr:hypothetical protein [Candidatus Eisenbacteria bacterium]